MNKDHFLLAQGMSNSGPDSTRQRAAAEKVSAAPPQEATTLAAAVYPPGAQWVMQQPFGYPMGQYPQQQGMPYSPMVQQLPQMQQPIYQQIVTQNTASGPFAFLWNLPYYCFVNCCNFCIWVVFLMIAAAGFTAAFYNASSVARGTIVVIGGTVVLLVLVFLCLYRQTGGNSQPRR
jgi:hypothetical protein